MNTLFLSLLGVSIFSLLIYFLSNKFTRKNKDYVENYPIIKGYDLKEYVSKEEPVLLKGTIKEAKNRSPKKETSRNQKSNSSEDLSKSEKSSKKKYYSKKKKNSKKDKGDDLILS